MATLATERARTRLDQLAAAGLSADDFGAAAVEVLATALPFVAACVAPADPATELITGTVKWGGLTDEQDDQWAFWEYESAEPYDFREVVRRPGGVTTAHLETGGHPLDSPRVAEFFHQLWGFTDELRLALRVDGLTWGFVALFRDGERSAFTPAELTFASEVAPTLGRGLRAGLVTGAAMAADDGIISAGVGPAVIVLDGTGQVLQASVGAQTRVTELGGGPLGDAPLPMSLLSLAGAARTYAAGRTTQIPRMRLRTRGGGWVVAHASPLMAMTGGPADVVLTIEEARPPEVVPLIVAAFGLTAREQSVVQLVLRGVSTTEIARELHLSAYTVQDHLKSIFAKADVRSRRELTARVFFDQYAPRMAGRQSAGPSGWFGGA
ncbi:response regulator transcription factor [Nakamurella sp.]|uniref:response regulator transcription factor n=1 Tax=Nakamurella sp. TaxID=1869182 RepID=UPI003B3BA70D